MLKIYGANLSHNIGDNIYTIPTGKYETIWDAGGIDTITAEGVAGPVSIDLIEGEFLSEQYDGNGGLFIAYGANIENATGSDGDDALYGNALNNVLIGGAGHDYLIGNAGADVPLQLL